MTTVAIPYPFVRVRYIGYMGDDGGMMDSWRPGTEEMPVYPDDSRSVAAGMGSMLIHLISTHKPPGFPERVFYTRSWIDPDGRPFGKRCCRVATRQKFNRVLKGYRYDYTVDPTWTMVPSATK